ncbi:uncharacterized protein LOC102806976, partial [Saccoglossus kowalevskii]|uniref:Uncharacterized protein LOC102806976 n=1 Tax=Saccoglossus kowalevskii TaxID=10224 RepID=A0ABM0MW17_SACKO
MGILPSKQVKKLDSRLALLESLVQSKTVHLLTVNENIRTILAVRDEGTDEFVEIHNYSSHPALISQLDGLFSQSTKSDTDIGRNILVDSGVHSEKTLQNSDQLVQPYVLQETEIQHQSFPPPQLVQPALLKPHDRLEHLSKPASPKTTEQSSDRFIGPSVAYNIMLNTVCEEIESSDLEKIKFILRADPCTDNPRSIPARYLEAIKSTRDLMNELERHALLSSYNLHFLQYLLFCIGRLDLHRKVLQFGRNRGNALRFFDSNRQDQEDTGYGYVNFHFEGSISHFDMDDLENFRSYLQLELGIPRECINVTAIQSGSVVVTFQLPDCIIPGVREILTERVDSLKTYGIIAIQINGQSLIRISKTDAVRIARTSKPFIPSIIKRCSSDSALDDRTIQYGAKIPVVERERHNLNRSLKKAHERVEHVEDLVLQNHDSTRKMGRVWQLELQQAEEKVAMVIESKKTLEARLEDVLQVNAELEAKVLHLEKKNENKNENDCNVIRKHKSKLKTEHTDSKSIEMAEVKDKAVVSPSSTPAKQAWWGRLGRQKSSPDLQYEKLLSENSKLKEELKRVQSISEEKLSEMEKFINVPLEMVPMLSTRSKLENIVFLADELYRREEIHMKSLTDNMQFLKAQYKEWQIEKQYSNDSTTTKEESEMIQNIIAAFFVWEIMSELQNRFSFMKRNECHQIEKVEVEEHDENTGNDVTVQDGFKDDDDAVAMEMTKKVEMVQMKGNAKTFDKHDKPEIIAELDKQKDDGASAFPKSESTVTYPKDEKKEVEREPLFLDPFIAALSNVLAMTVYEMANEPGYRGAAAAYQMPCMISGVTLSGNSRHCTSSSHKDNGTTASYGGAAASSLTLSGNSRHCTSSSHMDNDMTASYGGTAASGLSVFGNPRQIDQKIHKISFEDKDKKETVLVSVYLEEDIQLHKPQWAFHCEIGDKFRQLVIEIGLLVFEETKLTQFFVTNMKKEVIDLSSIIDGKEKEICVIIFSAMDDTNEPWIWRMCKEGGIQYNETADLTTEEQYRRHQASKSLAFPKNCKFQSSDSMRTLPAYLMLRICSHFKPASCGKSWVNLA